MCNKSFLGFLCSYRAFAVQTPMTVWSWLQSLWWQFAQLLFITTLKHRTSSQISEKSKIACPSPWHFHVMSTNLICICIYSPVSPSPYSWELYACIIFNTERQTVLGTKSFVSERSCVFVAHKSWHTSSRQGGMETSLCLLTVWYCQLCYHGTSHSVCHHFFNHRSSLHSSRTIKKEKAWFWNGAFTFFLSLLICSTLKSLRNYWNCFFQFQKI